MQHSTLKNLLMNLPPNTEIIITNQSKEVYDETMEIVKRHTDVIIHYNFIKNHEDKEVWGVGGRIINVGNQYSTTASIEDTVKNFITNHSIRRIGGVRWWDANLIYNFDAIIRTYVDHVQGCNMSYRKEALIKAGGFDERFGGSAHLEETDLCMRI